MQPRRLSAKYACRVAGYDRDRLNQYIADDTYPCAPSTIAGRRRLFTEDDTVALYFFAWLVGECRWSPREAGVEACLIRQGLQVLPDSKNLTVIVPHIGSKHIVGDGDAAAADPAGHITGGSSIKATRTYNVEHARALIAHGFDEEFATKDDDE